MFTNIAEKMYDKNIFPYSVSEADLIKILCNTVARRVSTPVHGYILLI